MNPDTEPLEKQFQDLVRGGSDTALTQQGSLGALKFYLNAAAMFAEKGVFLELVADPLETKKENLYKLIARVHAFFTCLKKELDKNRKDKQQ